MSWFSNRALNEAAARPWEGRKRRYDLLEEVAIATGIVLAIAVLMAVLVSSPDERPSTIRQWSRGMPVNFLETANEELDGTSDTATYGPPYNNNGAGQHILFIHLQSWLGVSHPVDAPREFVLEPLESVPNDPTLTGALATYRAASVKQRAAWSAAYEQALPEASVSGGNLSLPPGSYGPVATMMSSLLVLADSGGVEGELLTSGHFYQTDYTKPLLFLADGGELQRRANAQHLLGTQWGMMNETGSFPGQVWLWLYTFWYQIEPFKSAKNGDAFVMLIMGALSLAFILIPFIPGVRDIPRAIPLHRLIWRNHHREQRERDIEGEVS
ncbi:MAG: hypothetical protein ACYCUM_03470 [Solirubrobacteraceae bacterium]